jgi:hypothetical protein
MKSFIVLFILNYQTPSNSYNFFFESLKIVLDISHSQKQEANVIDHFNLHHILELCKKTPTQQMESCWKKGQAQIETQVKLRLGPIKWFHNSLMSDLSKNKHEKFHQKGKKLI